MAINNFTIRPRRLLIFGGKGGVGKTTAAAATALNLAQEGAHRVLLVSTDPAHSLSDCFGQKIGDFNSRVAGEEQLDAMEINPALEFEELKDRYHQWIDQLFESAEGSSGWEIQFDRQATRELVSLTPPGIDEIAALSVVMDLLGRNEYSSIVLDTAPTGHLLRLLELPEIALSWVKTLIKLLLKYKEVLEAGAVGEDLIKLSKNIKRLRALIINSKECEFITVAIAEMMSLEETIRLSESLKRLRIPLGSVLINNVVPAEAAAECAFCGARRQSQQKVIALFRKRVRHVKKLAIAPQQAEEIVGSKHLRRHYSSWQLLEKGQ